MALHKDLTKAELIRCIKERTKNASPVVKQVFYASLIHKNKTKLKEYLHKLS